MTSARRRRQTSQRTCRSARRLLQTSQENRRSARRQPPEIQLWSLGLAVRLAQSPIFLLFSVIHPCALKGVPVLLLVLTSLLFFSFPSRRQSRIPAMPLHVAQEPFLMGSRLFSPSRRWSLVKAPSARRPALFVGTCLLPFVSFLFLGHRAAKLIDNIGPCLHHLTALFQVFCMVVRCTRLIPFNVG